MEEIIKKFIETKNTRALLVTGPWGCGKTHYFKNDFEHFLHRLKRQGEPDFRVFHFSVFGLSSLVEIERAFYTEAAGHIFRIPKLALKLSQRVNLDLVNSEFVKVKSLGLSKLLGSITSHFSRGISKVSFGNTILVIDDTERLGSLGSDQRVFFESFVNELIESYDLKIILVTNLEKIGSKELNHVPFEKLSFLTVEYKQSKEDLFKSVLNKHSENKDAIDFILSRLDHLLNSYHKEDHLQLRALERAVIGWKLIWPKLKVLRENDDENIQPDLLFDYWTSFFICSNELSYSSLFDYSEVKGVKLNRISYSVLQQDILEEGKTLPGFRLLKKYGRNIFISPAVFKLLDAWSESNEQELEKEFLIELRERIRIVPSEINQFFSRLNSIEIARLNNAEYKLILDEMISISLKGLPTYDYVFHVASRIYYLDNPCEYKEDFILEQIQLICEKSKHNWSGRSGHFDAKDYSDYERKFPKIYAIVANAIDELERAHTNELKKEGLPRLRSKNFNPQDEMFLADIINQNIEDFERIIISGNEAERVFILRNIRDLITFFDNVDKIDKPNLEKIITTYDSLLLDSQFKANHNISFVRQQLETLKNYKFKTAV